VNLIEETGLAALLFAATFLFGERVRPLRRILRNERAGLSFGAGMSVAYVFIHVMPELHLVRTSFTAGVGEPLPFHGMVVYFTALVGFLLFYFLDRLREREHRHDGRSGAAHAFRLDLGAFSAYVGVVGYVLVRNLGETHTSTLLFSLAIAAHFLALDHSLATEHGDAYRRTGRATLAGAALLGWGLGFAIPLPLYVVALLVAFISGAVIVNATIMELHDEKDGHLFPFVAGGVVYGLLLLPLG
jgi:hypothetical protein